MVGIGPVPLGDGNFDIGSAMTVDGMLAHLPAETGGPDVERRADFVPSTGRPGVTDDASGSASPATGV